MNKYNLRTYELYKEGFFKGDRRNKNNEKEKFLSHTLDANFDIDSCIPSAM